MTKASTSDGRGGVALWRQIADAIRLDIVAGRLATGDRLEGEIGLAERFAVNRHTVRRAILALEQEGVLRVEHGRGTFVAEARRLSYPIGRRTRFAEGLAGQVQSYGGELLSSVVERATSRIATALGVKVGTRVIRMESLSFADGRPLARATGWVAEARFPGFDAAYRELGSVTRVLARFGIDDYQRGSTRISARHATTEEAQALRLAPGAVLLVSEAVDVDMQGAPIHTLVTRFPADRLELVV